METSTAITIPAEESVQIATETKLKTKMSFISKIREKLSDCPSKMSKKPSLVRRMSSVPYAGELRHLFSENGNFLLDYSEFEVTEFCFHNCPLNEFLRSFVKKHENKKNLYF